MPWWPSTGPMIVFDKSVDEALPELRRQFPRYACFVAKPARPAASSSPLSTGSRGDSTTTPIPTYSGASSTGYDAESPADRQVRQAAGDPSRRRRHRRELRCATKASGIANSTRPRRSAKRPARNRSRFKRQADSTKYFVDALNEYQADLFVTSGHASDTIGRSVIAIATAYFAVKDGQLFGVDTPASNCPCTPTIPRSICPWAIA